MYAQTSGFVVLATVYVQRYSETTPVCCSEIIAGGAWETMWNWA